MRGVLAIVASLLVWTSLFAAPRPSLETERRNAQTRLWVALERPDGSVGRHLLRESRSAISVAASGRDPDGRAFFATWDEDGSRWYAVSRDAGASWTEGRPLQTELRLRDGAVRPGSAMPLAPEGYALPDDGRLMLVQFRTVGLPEWREALARTGAEVLNHFPHNAHIVRADAAARSRIAELDFVERTAPYHPWYRISSELRTWLAGDAGSDPERRVRVVTFDWGPEAKQRVRLRAESLGGRVAESWPSGHILELWLDRDQLRLLAAHDDVMWADEWSPPGQDMDIVRQSAGVDWVEDNHGYCGQGVRGEVMDGGIQDDHIDFDGLLFHGPYNLDSHGTSTYGIVFGNGDRDGDGNAQATGQMPCAEAQGIFADYGFLGDRFAHTQELKGAPYFASFQTNSWGGGLTTAYNSVSQEMDDIIWRLDIAILQSQSNTGNQASRPQAWAKNIIAVGAVNHFDTADTSDDAWNFSGSIGPAEDGRIKPDVSYWYDSIFTTTSGGGYRPDFGGTSSSTPVSAGILGLMVQMWADNVWGTDPVGATVFDRQPSFSMMKALLVNNAQQYDFVGSGADLSRYKQGWGRPSARVAYERALNSLVIDQDEPLVFNDSITFSADVAPGEAELKVTLVYPDPPGTTSASLHRINDLNLEVTSPSGTTYHGNHGLIDGPESVPGGTPDALNTVENVFVRNPESGTWDVKVEAVEVNQDAYLATTEDDVTFSLVVTGGLGRYTAGAGRVRFLGNAYACDDSVGVRVRDGNVGASTVEVSISSETEPTAETVTLTETSPGSGTFIGAIPGGTAAPTAGDGLLSVSDGDTLTVDYLDADDGEGGVNLPREATSTVDCTFPQISQIAETGVNGSSADIVWTTDEKSTSAVFFGPVVPPAQEVSSPGLVTAHSVSLNNLAECTVYYYAVESADIVGNLASADNGGAYYHFETLGDFGEGLQSCHEGRISIDSTTVGCTSSLDLRVVDLDLNVDPGAVDSVSVAVTSSTEIDPESAVLIETGPNTSIFTGTIPTDVGPATPADGMLQVAHDDLLTATYADADDGTGANHISFDTLKVDCQGPLHLSVTVSEISDSTATVAWTNSEPTTGYVEWGTTPALGNQTASGTLATDHSVTIGTFDECASVYFRVVSADNEGNTGVADVGGAPFEFDTFSVPGIVFQDDFESDLGWTLQGEWEIGAPQGLGTAPGDPTSAFSGTNVVGHDLSGQGSHPGDFETNTNQSAVSPVVDTSALANVELRFQRWLNVGTQGGAFLEAKNASGTWDVIWTTGSSVTESAWSEQTYNVSAAASGNSSLQLRFRMAAFGLSGTDAGWNVDRLSLRDGSLPPFAACSACSSAPTFAGILSATDLDGCSDSGVMLSWPTATGWGGGNGGTFAVYRDTQPGFVPSPTNLIVAGVSGPTWVDPTAPDDVDLYYVVRAENDESCGIGPYNGGVMDANDVQASTRDATSQGSPSDPGGTLLLQEVNDAHVRLTWAAAPGAAVYPVYRSLGPDTGFAKIAEPTGLSWEDPGALVDGQSWYYLVRGADVCGNEGVMP